MHKKINPYVFPIKGDISRADTVVLYEMARKTNRPILEFGVGGSTIILAASSDTKVVSVDDQQKWIDKTKKNLVLYGLADRVDFRMVDYKKNVEFEKLFIEVMPDFVYIDSLTHTRPGIFHHIFPLLGKGAEVLIHDCRRQGDIDMFMDIFKKHSNNIEIICPCYRESNMFYVKKSTQDRVYVNWNDEEAGNNRVGWDDINGTGYFRTIK